jgi:hypothetical protein
VEATMNDFLDKVKDLANKHDDQVDKGLERAGEEVDQRTGEKYSDQIDKGVTAAQDYTGEDRH